MPSILRELTLKDQCQVNNLCATIWEGNDYVPTTFPKWVVGPHDYVLGIFEGKELVAICNLETIEGTDIAWVQGLRVREAFQQRGYGAKITEAIIERAMEKQVRTLWYVTGSQNEGSQKVAEKLGFHRANSVGSLRLEKPFPDHSKPSPGIVPLKVSPWRLFDILAQNPDLVPSVTLPLAWEFDFKNQEGIERLGKQTEFKVIIDETGSAQGLYYGVDRHRPDEFTIASTVFATDRAVFVDMMSRILDEVIASKADRAVFFLGPGPSEWALGLGYVDEEFIGRKFLLYEKNPVEG